MRIAQIEGGAEIEAGPLTIAPVFDGKTVPPAAGDEDGPNIVFGHFISLMRRRCGLNLEKLADWAWSNRAHPWSGRCMGAKTRGRSQIAARQADSEVVPAAVH